MKSKITRAEAKERTLLVWSYLMDHPECTKSHLPHPLRRKIQHCVAECPLCELFMTFPDKDSTKCNPRCPLVVAGIGCMTADSVYFRWQADYQRLSTVDRQKAIDDRRSTAKAILDAVTAWEVK